MFFQMLMLTFINLYFRNTVLQQLCLWIVKLLHTFSGNKVQMTLFRHNHHAVAYALSV
jgi:hypothetical protein